MTARRHPGPGPRLAAHRAAGAQLAGLDDAALVRLLGGARPLGTGIGGVSALLDAAGVPVFVKRVPLTDIEREPGAYRSTADPFGLPPFCHYGIGGPGYGAWRELAAHERTTGWALAEDPDADGPHSGFPLLHHWRVLPGAAGLPDELADTERVVADHAGSRAVRARVEALGRAGASLVLFLEYLPTTLHDLLNTAVAEGGQALVRACAFAERELASGVRYMGGRGLVHFDAHFRNLLTDGRRLYFSDFGLACADDFAQSTREREFVAHHGGYDSAYTRWYLVIWLLTGLCGVRGGERDALVAACAQGDPPRGLPHEIAALLVRHGPLAVTMNRFQLSLQEESRQTPYPEKELASAALTRPGTP